jgi:predicted nucleic acid-binding Zn ribbon protein
MTQSDESNLFRMLASASRPGTSREPQPISEILSRLMSRRGYGNRQIGAEWNQIWSAAAGQWAGQTRVGKFSRGVLEVIVGNSSVLQELTFCKKQLLQSMQERAPHFPIKDLRFRVGETG